MIRSLQYNNSLLRRPKAFSKLKEHINQRVENHVAFKHKQIDPAELKRIREEIVLQIREERRRNNLRIAFSTTLIAVLVVCSISAFFLLPRFGPNETEKWKLEQQLQQEKRRKDKADLSFEVYLSDGYKWLFENRYHNAQFQFELAVKKRPENYEANMGLTKTLLKKCSLHQVDCERADRQLNAMLERFSDPEATTKTISDYLLVIGDTMKAERVMREKGDR